MDFSSPYRVKVVKEVAKQRREEVDLDTGRRRRWVETIEVEVLDLCGSSPDKPQPGTIQEEGEVSRGSFRSPLKDQSRNLVSNLIKELTRDKSPHSLVPPPASPSPLAESEESRTCPACHRIFKSLRGVTQHRAKDKSCAVDKGKYVTVRRSARLLDLR